MQLNGRESSKINSKNESAKVSKSFVQANISHVFEYCSWIYWKQRHYFKCANKEGTELHFSFCFTWIASEIRDISHKQRLKIFFFFLYPNLMSITMSHGTNCSSNLYQSMFWAHVLVWAVMKWSRRTNPKIFCTHLHQSFIAQEKMCYISVKIMQQGPFSQRWWRRTQSETLQCSTLLRTRL